MLFAAPLLAALLSSPGLMSVAHAAETDSEGLETVLIMRVAGSVTIEPSGEVTEVKIDTPLIASLRSSVERTVRLWHFKPVLIDGTARRVSTEMGIVLSAATVSKDYRVQIDSVQFLGGKGEAAVRADGDVEQISAGRLAPPMYPHDAQLANVNGAILLAIRVTPEGKVGEVQAVQSMLYEVPSHRGSLRRGLASLEAAALDAARRWTFTVPADAATRSPEQMTVTVPVEFNLGYLFYVPGQWITVMRLPRRPIAWLPATAGDAELGLAGVGAPGVSPLTGAFQLSKDVAGTPLR